MGMSTIIVGIKLPGNRWKAMKKIYDACNAAEIPVPQEVEEFFEDKEPDNAGVIVNIRNTEAVREYSDDNGDSSGFEVDLCKLPKDITVLRFYNSW